jgi:hypothetical protein
MSAYGMWEKPQNNAVGAAKAANHADMATKAATT